MGGNRHGNGSEQRVTLDLADDYHQILQEAHYVSRKREIGKQTAAHKGVRERFYFANDILFQEYGKSELVPYRVTINIKENENGAFVYSYNAELSEKFQNNRPSTRQTLHADDTPTMRGSNARPEITVAQKTNGVKTSLRENVSQDSEGRELTEAQEDYFAESAIRDKNGALQVMYHATDNEFTVFSREYLGENTDAWSEEAQATAHIGFWFNTQDLSKHSKALYARGRSLSERDKSI